MSGGSDSSTNGVVSQDLAYAACNTMTILVILTKFIVFSLKRDKFFDLIKFCYKHFWHGGYDTFGERVLQDCETRGIYCVCTFTFLALCVVFSYTLQPIVGESLRFSSVVDLWVIRQAEPRQSRENSRRLVLFIYT